MMNIEKYNREPAHPRSTIQSFQQNISGPADLAHYRERCD
jgi:hypothetical protein